MENYIQPLESDPILLEWKDINEIEKDILWIYANNVKQLNLAFVPYESFTKKYWQYLTIVTSEKQDFLRTGCLIIILAMLREYTDIPGGCRLVFHQTPLTEITRYVENFELNNSEAASLKRIALKGLKIASDITTEDLYKNDDLQHPLFDEFTDDLNWVDEIFIQGYLKKLMRA